MPVMSAGIRSGVNWIRLNVQSMTSAIVRTSIVLPRPGHALEQDVAVGEQAGERLADEVALADDDPADLALDGLRRARRTPRGRGVAAGAAAVCVLHGGLRSSASGRRRRSSVGIERAEVVADVVLDRERDVAAVERGLGVALEVGVDLLVRASGRRCSVPGPGAGCPAGSGRRRRSRRRSDGSPGLPRRSNGAKTDDRSAPSSDGRFGLVGPAGRPLPPMPLPSERAFEPPPPMAPWPWP